jgi:protein involved in temperature-dependent protein secretion
MTMAYQAEAASNTQNMQETDEALTASAERAEPAEIEALHERVRELEAANATMRHVMLVVAEGRMFWEPTTRIETCRFCTLKRGGEFGYSAKHDAECIVTEARALGF